MTTLPRSGCRYGAYHFEAGTRRQDYISVHNPRPFLHARAHSRYAHYDNLPSFSDFTAFGGWSTPAIKQYMGDKTSCGVGVDYNWYPDSFDEVREEAEKQQRAAALRFNVTGEW